MQKVRDVCGRWQTLLDPIGSYWVSQSLIYWISGIWLCTAGELIASIHQSSRSTHDHKIQEHSRWRDLDVENRTWRAKGPLGVTCKPCHSTNVSCETHLSFWVARHLLQRRHLGSKHKDTSFESTKPKQSPLSSQSTEFKLPSNCLYIAIAVKWSP